MSKTASILISGASDDLIEIEGDIREEFYYNNEQEDGDLLAFSDGTVLRITYSHSGVWRISPVVIRSYDSLTIEQAPEDDEDNYSDVANLTMPLDGRLWVVHGIGIAGAR